MECFIFRRGIRQLNFDFLIFVSFVERLRDEIRQSFNWSCKLSLSNTAPKTILQRFHISLTTAFKVETALAMFPSLKIYIGTSPVCNVKCPQEITTIFLTKKVFPFRRGEKLGTKTARKSLSGQYKLYVEGRK